MKKVNSFSTAFFVGIIFLVSGCIKQKSHADNLVQKLRDAGSDYVFIAAHRGGYEHDWEYKSPENSLANIDKAVKLGFDFYETDLRTTRDSQFVIMHDRKVDRTTDGTGNVYEMTLSQLKDLNLRYRDGRMSSEKVPTFNEFLDKGKGRILFKVDFKTKMRFLPDAVRLVEEKGMLDFVIFVLWYEKELADELLLMIESGMTYHSGLFLFKANSSAEVQLIIDKFHPDLIEITVGDEGITHDILKSLQLAIAENILVETATWDGPEEWELLINSGYRMLHTNEPEAMVKFLKNKGLR